MTTEQQPGEYGEPWRVDKTLIVAPVENGRPGGEVIVQCRPTVRRLEQWVDSEVHARRIVACVNACAGRDPETVLRWIGLRDVARDLLRMAEQGTVLGPEIRHLLEDTDD